MGHRRQPELVPAPAGRPAPTRSARGGGPAAGAPAERLVRRLARQLGIEAPPVHINHEARLRTSARGTRGLWEGGSVWLNPVLAPGPSGDRLVAHELVHAAQARLPAGDPRAAEEEAGRLAGPLLAGDAVWPTVGIGERAAAETLTGNPKLPGYAYNSPVAAWALPTLEDSEDGQNRQKSANVAQSDGYRLVRVHAQSFNPLRLPPGHRPDPGEVFEEGALWPESPWVPVLQVIGDSAGPVVETELSPSLYIGGRPSPTDIHQGGYGDCYFLAVLALIAQRRPYHLRQMVRPDGRGGAVVRFYRFEERSRCVPVDVVVSPELLYNGPQRTPGVNGGYELRAAHIRGALQYADWYGLLRGNILELHRRDRWDLARWVPILEKAYARFVEQYGLYGDTPPTSALSGYQQVDVGGKSHLLMPMLFGPDMFGAERRGEVDVSEEEGRDHHRVLELLLRQALRGPDHALLVFSAQTEHLSQRLNLQIAAAYYHPSWKTLSSTEQTQLVDVVRLYREARTGTVAERVAADTSYSVALRKAVNRTSAPGLLALANKAPFSDVVRLALSLSGGVKGQRYLVLAHAYAVVGVNIVFRRGWTGQPEVDEAASTVTLSNPWHGGEPDLMGRRQPLRPGDGIPNGTGADGLFTMTVAEVFRHFGALHYGIVPGAS